jgi:hypothetical protein
VPTGTTVVDTTLPATPPPAPRLTELVVHLTDCSPRLAVVAVDAAVGGAIPVDDDGRLAVVARALVSVRRSIDLREPKPAPAVGGSTG